MIYKNKCDAFIEVDRWQYNSDDELDYDTIMLDVRIVWSITKEVRYFDDGSGGIDATQDIDFYVVAIYNEQRERIAAPLWLTPAVIQDEVDKYIENELDFFDFDYD